MSTYVISDIHGCFDEFQDLLELIGFSDDDELYVLGDLIDRGPKNDECVKWMVDAGDNVTYMLGNHEQMMMASMNDDLANFKQRPESRGIWCQHGGKQTFRQCKRHCSPDIMRIFQGKVENAKLLTSPDVGDEPPILVHAGLTPPSPNEDIKAWMYQDENALLWNAHAWYLDEQVPPFDVVFGHTPTARLAFLLQDRKLCSEEELFEGDRWRIMNWNRKWAIDCGCVFGGNLGALRLDDFERFHVPCRKKGGYTNHH